MLLRCIKAEDMKLKHSIIWSACILIPIIPAVMGTANYLNNVGLLTEEWYSLWTQFTLFYSWLFYAPLIALYCSYLWRLEHLNSNWNVLMTAPVPVRDVFLGKLAVIFRVTVFTQIWVFILFAICGKLCGLPGMMPADTVLWMLRGTLAAAAIGTLQLLLSMVIRSFAVPIGIALAGCIFGFLFVNKGWGLYWPYSLMMVGMNANKSEDALGGELIPFLVSVAVFFTMFAAAAVTWLRKKDVKAQA